MIYYIIRHKASGRIMPLMRRNRGYSHWNPSKNNLKTIQELDIPRILKSRRQAEQCISQWNACPNMKYYANTSRWEGEDCDLDIKPDGRKKEDLEVVKVIFSVKQAQK